MTYRLKRDLPGYPAGSLFYPPFDYYGHSYIADVLDAFKDDTDWFEPVEAEQKKYWSVWFQPDGEDKAALFYKKLTKPQAEAVAEAIKETLAFITDPHKKGPFMGQATYKARQLLQEPTDE